MTPSWKPRLGPRRQPQRREVASLSAEGQSSLAVRGNGLVRISMMDADWDYLHRLFTNTNLQSEDVLCCDESALEVC